ncbi:MAG: Rpn family recombination-promoting nuclease/putative transposase [Spirochaetaceae bacterium]|nr:MAG: Rpn family recombination-promoting nuclease/putative transposase [Spirochaetaceae bacterium]
MDAINSPHDKFFHAVFSDEEHARDLLRNALPAKILGLLELSSLEISRESYIDEKLAVHQSDLLIRTTYRDSPVFVYFLIEHKSYHDRWTILQLLRYMVRIWDKELSQNKTLKKLPPIIPMIFYHGTRRWNQPVTFSSYLELKQNLRPYMPDFQVVLLDLQQTDDVDLKGAELFRAAMKIAKYARSQLKPHLGDILRAVSARPMDERHRTFLKVFLEYILQVGRDTQSGAVEEEIEKVGNEVTREVYMTIAEQLRAEGIEIGKQEGKLEGQILDKQQVLTRLLEKKFSPLDDTVKAKIRSCQDRERLDEAIDLFADGETFEQIINRLD